MATPMTPTQFLTQLRKWGVPYVEHDGWATHNRNDKGPWGPVEGVLLHHTGDDAPDAADLKVLWDGRSGLPGPLCQWAMDDEGTVHTVGWGRCNHAGLGAANVRDAVLTEDYGAYPPAPGPDTVDGNQIMYGQETTYSGSAPPTSAAYRATVRVFAAVCDFHGWSGRSCIGHKEWTSRKIDPGHLDMAQFRRDVDALLQAGPGGDDMPTAAEIADAVYEKFLTTNVTKPDGEADPQMRSATLLELAVVAGRHGFASERKLDQLAAAVSAVAAVHPDVDATALAEALAPLLAPLIAQQTERLSDADLAAIATAVNDELARRAAS